jgi:hypothetical protein
MRGMKKKHKPNNNAIALAGEFGVLSQLALLDYDANMTLGRTKSVDILVSIPRSRKMYRLEVKTKLRTNDNQDTESKIFGRVLGGWMMDKKHETHIDPLLFYCFVIIWKRTKKFCFFIVPSKVVARYVAEEHQLWRDKKKKDYKQTDMRTFRIGFDKEKYVINTPTVEEYEDNWKFRR